MSPPSSEQLAATALAALALRLEHGEDLPAALQASGRPALLALQLVIERALGDSLRDEILRCWPDALPPEDAPPGGEGQR